MVEIHFDQLQAIANRLRRSRFVAVAGQVRPDDIADVGVTLDDCERAHKALGPALDVADPFPHAYTLEVSSPGLDRPFKRIQDYRRAIGKRVTLKLKEPLAGQWRLVGTLIDVTDEAVTLEVSEPPPSRTMTVEHKSIAEGKRVVTW